MTGSSTNRTFCQREKHPVFLGGLPHDTTEEELKGHLSKFGEVKSILLPRWKQMRTLKGFAFVGFKSREGQRAALSYKGFTIRNKLMSISACVAPGKAKSLTRDQESRALYLTGIVNSLTEKDLVESFDSFGEVEIARIIIDHSTMQTKGYGFLVMNDKKGHALALEVGHVWIENVKIKAKMVTLSKVKNSAAAKNSKKPRKDDSTENTSSSPNNQKQHPTFPNQEYY